MTQWCHVCHRDDHFILIRKNSILPKGRSVIPIGHYSDKARAKTNGTYSSVTIANIVTEAQLSSHVFSTGRVYDDPDRSTVKQTEIHQID